MFKKSFVNHLPIKKFLTLGCGGDLPNSQSLLPIKNPFYPLRNAR